MKTLTQPLHLACALTLVATGLIAAPSYAQQGGTAPAAPTAPVAIQAALAADVGTLGEKFEGLAKVMAGRQVRLEAGRGCALGR